MTAQREQAEHDAESVRRVADATRQREIDRIRAEKDADTRRIEEENKAQITRMHMLTQAESRSLAAEREAEATVTRARATSEAQQITAEGVEREAGAVGRAEVHIEALRVENVQRRLEAEAVGIEAKADALKKYNESATFLELARLHIEGRARHPHRPGQGDGHRPDRRPHPDVRRRRRHRGQHPPALHVRVRDRGGAGRRGPSPCPRGCGIVWRATGSAASSAAPTTGR